MSEVTEIYLRGLTKSCTVICTHCGPMIQELYTHQLTGFIRVVYKYSSSPIGGQLSSVDTCLIPRVLLSKGLPDCIVEPCLAITLLIQTSPYYSHFFVLPNCLTFSYNKILLMWWPHSEIPTCIILCSFNPFLWPLKLVTFIFSLLILLCTGWFCIFFFKKLHFRCLYVIKTVVLSALVIFRPVVKFDLSPLIQPSQ